jgi:oligopeptidase B
VARVGAIVLSGCSAGGLAASATMLMYPHLFNTVMIGVPFVDVISSEIDTSVPWAQWEWFD